VLQKLEELVVSDAAVIEIYDSEVFLREIMGEKGLKVSRSWGQNDLMGKYLFAFYNERDIAELFLVQERYQILLILSLSSHPVIIEIIFKNNRLFRDWSQTSWQSWYLVVSDVAGHSNSYFMEFARYFETSHLGLMLGLECLSCLTRYA